jgi:hypothetical protein
MDHVLTKEIFFMDDNRKFPRRSVLSGAVLLATAALAVRMIPTKEALAQAKASKEAMQYQDKPNADKRCSNCRSFLPPNTCTVVEGPVSPDGYCLAWTKKA